MPMEGFNQYTGEGISGKYEIIGDDMQLVTVTLKDGEKVTCEPGSMSFMSDDVKAGVNCDSCCNRCMGGNPCIMSTYTGASDASYVALSPKLPAKIVPIECSALNGSAMRCKSGTYLGHIGDVKLDFDLDCNCLTCCCGGQGCVRQKVSGAGSAFLFAMGTVMSKELAEGEVLVVDTNSVVGWQDSVKLGIKAVGGCCTCCCGGEGLFNTTLTGPGRVYIQSYSREKFALALMALAGPKKGGGGGGGAPVEASEMER